MRLTLGGEEAVSTSVGRGGSERSQIALCAKSRSYFVRLGPPPAPAVYLPSPPFLPDPSPYLASFLELELLVGGGNTSGF